MPAHLNSLCREFDSTLLHSEWPKLHGVFAILSAVGLSSKDIHSSLTVLCDLSKGFDQTDLRSILSLLLYLYVLTAALTGGCHVFRSHHGCISCSH